MDKRLEKRIRFFILIIAVLSLLYGIKSGELNTIFLKASRVCLECCGIG